MAAKRFDVTTTDFSELAAVIQEADDIGVLLRGHIWLEALLEYAARGRLARPDAIDWMNARFEHKIALGEALGAVGSELAGALRGFNRLRNRLAHEMVFEVVDGDVSTFVGRLNQEQQQRVRRLMDGQLRVKVQIDDAHARGLEVEIDPQLEWYVRVMTTTRARLFAFVIFAVRELAIEGAFGQADATGTNDPRSFIRLLDEEVTRMTGGLYGFRPPSAS